MTEKGFLRFRGRWVHKLTESLTRWERGGGEKMTNSELRLQGGTKTELGRMLNRDLILYLLDLEVKRGRRYQNFLSILILDLMALSSENGGGDLDTSYQMLTTLLTDEVRETDVFGVLGEKRVIVLLPYADLTAGSQAKSRFESVLKYYDFGSKGYEVKIHQVSFPTNGTDTPDLMQKVMD
jgi:GGDEF domain-containing protein